MAAAKPSLIACAMSFSMSKEGVILIQMASDGTLINPSTDCVAMPEYTNLNDVIVDGRVESSAQGRIMGSFAVMPAASILNENCIILYSGTTGTYVSGQFYMCVESGGSYSWQPVTISGTEEDTYTANRALATNAQGQVVASGVTDTELGYLSGLGGSVVSLLNGKVDKVSGMGLSQNSYTTADKDKLAGIAAGAQVNVIEAVQNNGVAVPVSGKTVNITHPTKLSEFTNDTQFITSTVSNLQNYYDKTNVDALISAIPKFSIQVSQSGLPASGNSTTIYLVPKTAGSQDAYDEYLYVNGQWEKIGSTQVNFSFDQSGTDILINGTAIRSATTSQSGVMTATQVGSLNTAVSGVSSLQSQYGTLNSTVSDISGRLGTVESTLSTTVSQMSTLQSNQIISGQTIENTLQLNQQGGGRIDIPLPDMSEKIITTANLTGSLTGIININDINVTITETIHKKGISVDTIQSLPNTTVKGAYGISYIKNITDNELPINVSLINDDKYNLKYYITETIDIVITDTEFNLNIENGNYRMPIDLLYAIPIGGPYYYGAYRDPTFDISDDEYVYFTVSGGRCTITSTNCKLYGNKFRCTANPKTISGIIKIIDRIEKLN